MNRRQRAIIFGILGIAVTLAVAGFVLGPRFRQRWNTPLGPALDLPTHTLTALIPETPLPTLATEGATLRPEDSIPEATATKTRTPTPTPEPLCGGPPTMTILAVGADNRSNTYDYGLADVIRIVRVDFVTPKVTMLSIPRDVWVEIPGISDHYGITHGKLNQAYFYGSPGMGYYDDSGGGPGLLARTLDMNFGLRVDHYTAVNMRTFVRIVDAVGGIDIYLPNDVDGRPIDDKTEDMGYFYAGQQHLNGEAALRLSRIRKKYNDLTRMDNQNLVLCSLKEKILSPAVLPDIPKIIASFQDSVLTDLSPAQLGQLACLAPRVKQENLIFTDLPEELLEAGWQYSPQLRGRTYVFQPDAEAIQSLLADFQAGIWPDKPGEPSCP